MLSGQGKRLSCLLVIISVSVAMFIVMVPRLTILPHSTSFTAISSSLSTATLSQSTQPTESVHRNHWVRLANFYILAGHKDDHYLSALVAETAGDCRTFPKNASSSMCRRAADIYLLYSNDDELRAAQVAVNVTRYFNHFLYLPCSACCLALLGMVVLPNG